MENLFHQLHARLWYYELIPILLVRDVINFFMAKINGKKGNFVWNMWINWSWTEYWICVWEYCRERTNLYTYFEKSMVAYLAPEESMKSINLNGFSRILPWERNLERKK